VLVALGDLGLRGWQSLGGFLIFRVVRVDDLGQVLLINHSWHYYLSLPLLLPLKSWGTTSRSISQLFWSATSGFAALSTLDLVLWCLSRAKAWGGWCAGG
jgi:hypothetical protein